jgi:hypothetical protein
MGPVPVVEKTSGARDGLDLSCLYDTTNGKVRVILVAVLDITAPVVHIGSTLLDINDVALVKKPELSDR